MTWAKPLAGAVAALLLALPLASSAGTLADCPATPNCVSSLATDPAKQVAPLQAGTSAEEARARLVAVLAEQPRVVWRELDTRLIHAEFTTRILRFTDDVHFLIGDDGTIQVRSASRVGHSDLGTNRRRVETLRDALDAAR